MESIDTALDRNRSEFAQLIAILFDDVRYYLDHNDHSQRDYRTTIRAIYAWMDGMITSLHCTLINHKIVGDASKVTDDELNWVLDHYDVPSDKKVKRLTFHDLVKKTLRAFADACKVDFDFSKHSQDWEKFTKCTPIRHRVVHPKSPNDLIIQQDEMTQVANSAAWLNDTIEWIANNRNIGKNKKNEAR